MTLGRRRRQITRQIIHHKHFYILQLKQFARNDRNAVRKKTTTTTTKNCTRNHFHASCPVLQDASCTLQCSQSPSNLIRKQDATRLKSTFSPRPLPDTRRVRNRRETRHRPASLLLSLHLFCYHMIADLIKFPLSLQARSSLPEVLWSITCRILS